MTAEGCWAIEEKRYSQSRACRLVGMHAKTYRYRPRRVDDGEIRRRLRELAVQRRRFGYRRLHILLAREGVRLNHKRLFRIYREEHLTVRRRGGRKRALGTRAPLILPKQVNHRWSLDFASDALLDSRRFRILAVVDDFSRESLALISDTSLSGARVARELDRIAAQRGYPGMIVSDNDTELTSHTICVGNRRHGVHWHCITQANRCRTALRRASSTACAMSASMSTCSPVCRQRVGSSKPGGCWGAGSTSIVTRPDQDGLTLFSLENGNGHYVAHIQVRGRRVAQRLPAHERGGPTGYGYRTEVKLGVYPYHYKTVQLGQAFVHR